MTLIKTILCTEDRLSDLSTILSIEKEIVLNISDDKIIDEFAASDNNRRSVHVYHSHLIQLIVIKVIIPSTCNVRGV